MKKHFIYCRLWKEKVRISYKKIVSLQKKELANMNSKCWKMNWKLKKENRWELKNMQIKKFRNMKETSIKKIERRNQLNEKMKNLESEILKMKKRWEIYWDNFKFKRRRRKQWMSLWKGKLKKYNLKMSNLSKRSEMMKIKFMKKWMLLINCDLIMKKLIEWFEI